MRRPGLGLAVLALVGACNQILGNDDGHHLIADVEPGGGTQGSGASSSSGGKSSGTSGKTSSSGSQSDAGAGVISYAGSDGEGGDNGGGPCVPAGAEDCLNGADDDCNGVTDCEDPTCNGLTACVPAPSGSSFGYFLDMGDTCKAGYTPVTLHQGLTAPYECPGCTCTPQSADCDASLGASYPGTCPGFQIDGNTYNVFASGCQPVTVNSTQVHYYSIRGFATCTAGGVGVPSTPAWAATRTFCELVPGKGCASGSVCAPLDPTTNCARVPGQSACGGTFNVSTGDPWSPSFTDERTCSSCQCAAGISSCGAAHIQLFSQAGCQGSVVNLGSGADQGDNCALPFTPQSGRITGGSPATNQCPVNPVIIGELTADDPTTICCH